MCSNTAYTRADVPPDQPPGPVKLSWMAVVDGGTVAVTNIATDGLNLQVS
ncbi:hypothetical protein ACFQZ4_36905 [Catellatospora coxensis]|uniref:Uncharacterized protein n=1 Tax=Catellatospora coxensis TaxID=310354 RepID=A0A8J3L417_9ACTN|nr:hypothetical protein Cco03nite_53490 [Catellatospora coxensis]